MPALYLFNRRTLLAGDDLQLPSLAWGTVAAAQLFLFLPYLLYYTITLLLTSPSKADLGLDDDDMPGDTGNNNQWVEQQVSTDRRRILYEVDDYFAAIEREWPSMQTEACSNSTSHYTDFTTPYIILLYLIGMAIYSACSLWYEQRIFQHSSLGTPTMDIELRAPLRELMEFKWTYLALLNCFLLIFGSSSTFWFMSGYLQCFPTVWWIVWFILFLTQAIQFLLVGTTLVSLWRVRPAVLLSSQQGPGASAVIADSNDFYQRHENNLHTHNNVEMAEELWQSRCEGCCRILAISTCFLFGGKGIVSHAAEGGGEKFYGDIARALADYFADFGDGSSTSGERGLDVVPSDVGLGFVMLRHIQAQRKMLAQRDALQQTSNYGSRSGSYNDVSLARRESNTNALTLPPNQTTLLFRYNTTGLSRMNPDQCNDDDELNQSTASQTEEAYGSYSRTVLSPTNPEDLALLEEGARFARHQLAIYTWILYYYQFPVSGTFRLIGKSLKAKMKCKGTVNSTTHPSRQVYEPCSDIEAGIAGSGATTEMNAETIVGDNYLRIHEATMLAHAGLEKSDIAYASFEAGFYETPYCIIIDRKWKSIVLSIRGSLTLEDCVVDVLLDPSPLDSLGEKYGFNGTGQYCHGGVLECTNWLHEDLMR